MQVGVPSKPPDPERKLKILVFTQYFWPENFIINSLVKGLLTKKVEVNVVTAKPNYPHGRIYAGFHVWSGFLADYHGAVVHRLPICPRGRGGALRLICNYLSFVLSGLFLAPLLLRGKKFDVIFVFGISPILQAIPAIFLKKLKGSKLIIWVQDLWPESLAETGFIRNKFILGIVRQLVRYIYSNADLILVQSEAFIPPVAKLCDSKKIKYYPNCAVDLLADYRKTDTCPVEGLGKVFSVVFAGNLGTVQAMETIIEAAELLKDSEIIIYLVGDGSRSNWIKDQIAKRKLENVVMTGRFPIEAMPSILCNADALLVSLVDRPIFSLTVPSKIPTYFAAGKPIIACLNGEGARVVHEAQAGICCPAEDAFALAETIRKLSQMTTLELSQLGENGRHYFKLHYDEDMLVDQLIRITNDVIKNT